MPLGWIVEYYRRENGEIPVVEFMMGLPPKHRAKAQASIDLLEEFGSCLREPYVKSIKGAAHKGIWELRVRFARDISRIFYFTVEGNTFVLLSGFIKKTNSTPSNELERAKRYMEDYRRRQRDG